nr:hypothetical protein [Tanacetum cinerariifolium]
AAMDSDSHDDNATVACFGVLQLIGEVLIKDGNKGYLIPGNQQGQNLDIDKMRQRHNDFLDDYFESLDKERIDRGEEPSQGTRDPTKEEEEDSESLESYQWNYGKTCAPIDVEKVKEKLEHFGNKLEKEEDCNEQHSAYYGKDKSEITCHKCHDLGHYGGKGSNQVSKYHEIFMQKNGVDDFVDIPFDDEAWAEATCFTKNHNGYGFGLTKQAERIYRKGKRTKKSRAYNSRSDEDWIESEVVSTYVSIYRVQE